MRYLIFIFLFSISSAIGQEIKYTLYLKDPCTNKLEDEGSYSYYLEKDSLKYKATYFDNKTITLPSFGDYNLIIPSLGEAHKINISKEINTDTLELPRIQEFVVTHSKHTYIFRNCEGVINGKDTSYYSNGAMRLRANFRKGYVIGKLKEYFQNGDLKRVSNYDKKGYPIDETFYYQNGKVKQRNQYGKKGRILNMIRYDEKREVIDEWNHN